MVVTWNTLDKSANVTLSGGSLVATTTSATQGAVRATASTSTTKTYVEFTISNITGTLWSVGFANALAALGTAMGSDANSTVFQPNQTGRAFFNNASLGADYAGAVNQTVCCAFDPVAKLIWFRYGFGYWNGVVTADPASGVGGRSVAAIAAGPYFPVFAANGSGASVTARFGALDTWFPVPAGFALLDVNAQAYEAVAKLKNYAVLGAPQNALSAAKLKQYGVLGAPQNALSVAKIRAYAILQDIPYGPQTEKWDVPRGVKRVVYQDGTTASSQMLLASSSPSPFKPPLMDLPYRLARRILEAGGAPSLALIASGVPFFASAIALPIRRRALWSAEVQGFNLPRAAPGFDEGSISIIW